MLKIELRPGEAIRIGDAVVTLESKSGQAARISVQADRSVPVRRIVKDNGAAQIAGITGITGTK